MNFYKFLLEETVEQLRLVMSEYEGKRFVLGVDIEFINTSYLK